MSERVPTFRVDTGCSGLGYGYGADNPAFDTEDARALRELWCGVIRQALLDLQNTNPNNLLEKQQAHRWLLSSSDFFPWVCRMAGVSETVIRGAAQRIMAGDLRIETPKFPRKKPQ